MKFSNCSCCTGPPCFPPTSLCVLIIHQDNFQFGSLGVNVTTTDGGNTWTGSDHGWSVLLEKTNAHQTWTVTATNGTCVITGSITGTACVVPVNIPTTGSGDCTFTPAVDTTSISIGGSTCPCDTPCTFYFNEGGNPVQRACIRVSMPFGYPSFGGPFLPGFDIIGLFEQLDGLKLNVHAGLGTPQTSVRLFFTRQQTSGTPPFQSTQIDNLYVDITPFWSGPSYPSGGDVNDPDICVYSAGFSGGFARFADGPFAGQIFSQEDGLGGVFGFFEVQGATFATYQAVDPNLSSPRQHNISGLVCDPSAKFSSDWEVTDNFNSFPPTTWYYRGLMTRGVCT